jgi:hypothetical protein
MEPTPDDIAGVVDLFGALTRPELQTALAELAFKQGGDPEPDALDDAVADAVESYHLVVVDPADTDAAEGDDADTDSVEGGDEVVVVGPVAFPTLPEGGEDLPHILDVTERDVDREAAAAAARQQFRADAAEAVDAGDGDRVERLLDTSYELEAWGGVDLSEARARLDAARDGTN